MKENHALTYPEQRILALDLVLPPDDGVVVYQPMQRAESLIGEAPLPDTHNEDGKP